MIRVRQRIHKLADHYKVLTEDERAEECAHCQELFCIGPDERHPKQDLVDKIASLTDKQLESPFGYDC